MVTGHMLRLLIVLSCCNVEQLHYHQDTKIPTKIILLVDALKCKFKHLSFMKFLKWCGYLVKSH